MKRISIVLALILCFNISTASAIWLNDEKETTLLTKGVYYTNINRFTVEGSYNINYVEADLKEPTVSLKVLSNKDITKKDTVLQTVKNNPDVISAINADFFTNYGSTASSEGMMIKDNKFITSPSFDKNYATFYLDNNMKAFADYFTYDIMVTSKRTGESSNILFYNKNANPMYMKVYDSNFGRKTPGTFDDGIEVVVEDNKVTKVISNAEGLEIPENGYVLHHSLRYSLFLADNFSVGDEVELKVNINPGIENIKEAVGGGTILLKEGKKANFTLKDRRNPITAIGINKERDKVILFTVDGRSKKSRGMTFSETADFLLSLGYYEAISFDGGGSTTLAGRMPGEDAKNFNMAGGRPVINSIGITATKPLGKFFDFSLNLSKDSVFLGDSSEIYITKAYDEYGNPYDVSELTKEFKTNNIGEFKDNTYIPKTKGEHILTVKVGDKEEKIVLKVYDNPYNLIPSEDGLDMGENIVSFTARDENGYGCYVPMELLNVEFKNSKGSFKDDKIIIDENNFGSVIVSFKGTKCEIPVGETKKQPVKDKFYKEGKDGFIYSVFGSINNSKTLFSYFAERKEENEANKSSLCAFTNVPKGVTVPAVKVTNYGREDFSHSLFLKLDNIKGSLRESKPAQWEWLLNVFKKGVPQKNVFINMPLAFDKMYDVEERDLLIKILKENLPDKNIFIITYDDFPSYKTYEGIRYIKIPHIKEFTKLNPYSAIDSLIYGKFVINGEDVSFSFVPVI